MPISAWRWRATRSRACATISSLLVMSATLDGARVAKLLGDAPVIESEGRAFPVETRYLGRDAARADRAAGGRRGGAGAARRSGLGRWCSCRAQAKSAAPRRCCKERVERSGGRHRAALRRARRADAGSRHRAGAAGPAQGRAGDLDRRDLAHHRGRAHRRRLRARARAALRARCRPDAARNRARVARRRRPAPRPRRPHRARRLLPAVGRAADRLARSLCAAGNSRRRSVGHAARSRAMGRGRSGQARVPRSAAGGRADRGAGAARRARRDRRAGPHHRRGPQAARSCRCRRGSPAWWSMPRREGAGQRAADIAAVLSERGLGGDDVDLGHRLDQFRRDRSRRGEDARRMAKRWADDAGASARHDGELSARRDPGARLSGPHRQESRRATARSCWPTAAAPMSIRRRRWRASRFSPSPSWPAPRRRAASCWRRRSRSTRSRRASPTDIERREEITFDAASASLRGRRSERLGAIALAEQPLRGRRPAPETAKKLADGIVRLGLDRLPWTQGAAAMARPRDVPAPRRRRRMAGPVRRGARGAAPPNGWRRCSTARPRWRRSRPTSLSTAIGALLPWNLQAPARRRSADAFRRAVRLVGADRLRGRGGAEARDPRAGAVRPRPPSDHRRRPGAAGGRAAVAGAPAGAGDARPAGLLARLAMRR